MKEEQTEFEKQLAEVDDTLDNSNDNLKSSQDSIINQNKIKDETKENNTIKKSPFFLNNAFSTEKKKNVHSLKVDRKKLKLHPNKKSKKTKMSSQNLFALSFFKNNEKLNVNSNNNDFINDKTNNDNELKEIKLESKIISSQNSQKSVEKNVIENGKEMLETTIEDIHQESQNSNSNSNNTYESQKCPICNICLDFYTLSEREKHVNLCIDSSIRKESKRNLGIKREDKKISSFYRNIKNNDNNEKLEEKSHYNDFSVTNDIQNEIITDTPNDMESTNISKIPSNNIQFKCKICDEETSFSTINDLYLHIYQCFSKIEPDHFFFKEKVNFILNQDVCFCCLKPWPVYEEKAAHIKECISIRKTYLEKIEGLIKHYLKQKEEKDRAFLDKNSKYRKYFKGSIYLKKKKADSMLSQVTSIEGNNNNYNNKSNNNNNNNNTNDNSNNHSIFNLNNIKKELKEDQIKNENTDDNEEDDETINKYDNDTEMDIDKRCCFCNEIFDDAESIDQHIETCINKKIDIIEDSENDDYKPHYIQNLTRCPCCSKKWLEYSMADLKEKLTHIRDCAKKNELQFSRISFMLNQYKLRFKDEKEKEKDKEEECPKCKSHSNSESSSSSKKDDNENENGSDNDLFETKPTNDEVKQSINKRKRFNSEDDSNNVVVLKIEDETTEDFNSNSISLKLTTNNFRTYRQRTLYDEIEEDHIKLAKVLSKSLYQDENQKIRLKIMNTSTILSVEDAHTYNFSRANSILNLTQQKYSLWEMSSLKPEDVLKAETVIEPLQKHSHELRMSLKNEGIDEYIATLTFPVPDRRLLKVNSIEGIDSYFNEQIKNRKYRLDKYKKLLTLQTSLWIKKMRKKQHSLKKELLSVDLNNPESLINTEIYNDAKSELNNLISDNSKVGIEFDSNNHSSKSDNNDIIINNTSENNSQNSYCDINQSDITSSQNCSQNLLSNPSDILFSNTTKGINDTDSNVTSTNDILFNKDDNSNSTTSNNDIKSDTIQEKTNDINQNALSNTDDNNNMDID